MFLKVDERLADVTTDEANFFKGVCKGFVQKNTGELFGRWRQCSTRCVRRKQRRSLRLTYDL